ncbi:MAG TPA: glutathione S-transferase family protein [Steroidobacteraceae bacterium]|nr:glutathione S-transferase family protein [Steroidobacteraceae bacterium]
MNTIRVSVLRAVPPFAQGLVRDLRVRWALEEAGLPYSEHVIGPEDQQSQDYRRLQPFGQVPAYQEGDLVLFESAAIVHHVAQRSEALMPPDPASRARVTAWMFSAMNSIEPFVQNLALIDLFYSQEEWAKLRRPGALQFLERRLNDLATALGTRNYLEGNRFTAADLLMTTVLRILRHSDVVAKIPALESYRLRCEARPAFQRALAGQMAVFARNAA